MDFESPNVVVPSVKELAKDPNMVTVPPRYIRYDQTQIQTNSSSIISSDKKIPIFRIKILVNHGVSNSLVEKVKQGVEELYKLPIEEKKKLWRKQGDKEGFGDPVVLSDEQILDWNDEFFHFTLPVALRNPHLFPNLPLRLSYNIITNGIYLSNEHRAIVNSTDERMSIATFLNSNEDCEIGPSHSLINQQNPAIYKTMSSKDYIKSMFSREYNGKSHIDAFKL
ncbi:hypothetical protein G4B88_006904 [Cannabis sativa]|uniref:Non-haem dioxygenase N-terminal domain-containing protein n=1 Tax=Cannabis sativa TaxID=3483 RepID=A0A7J6G3R3_CANSA|nr:hypothetical protein G4B88_006904 [Cannabis sativa]